MLLLCFGQCHVNVFCSQPPDAVFPNSYGQPEGCQQQNCTFYVEWRNNGDFIDFRMEGDGNGWIAMGITAQDSPLDRVSNTLLYVMYYIHMCITRTYAHIHTRTHTHIHTNTHTIIIMLIINSLG